jgi:hypothetical protein
MLRGLLLLLVLANLAFFSWSRGWLAPVWPAPRAGEREPERLAQQVRPQSVTVLTAAEAGAAAAAATAAAASSSTPASDAASAPALPLAAGATPASTTPNGTPNTTPSGTANTAVTAPGNVCLEAGPFTPTEATAAAAALQQVALPAGSWARVDGVAAQQWLVYAGRFADAAARRARQQEWARAGLQVQLLDAPADLAPGLVLARHLNRDAADAALAALSPTVRQVTRVVQLPPSPATSWLRAANADKALATRLTGLPAPWLGSFKACVR